MALLPISLMLNKYMPTYLGARRVETKLDLTQISLLYVYNSKEAPKVVGVFFSFATLLFKKIV